jgi:hypothetical protein
MKITNIKVITNILATLTGIISLCLINIYSNYATLILTVEILLLPLIFIVSNLYCEKLIEVFKDGKIDTISVATDKLREENIKQAILIRELKFENNLLAGENGEKS